MENNKNSSPMLDALSKLEMAMRPQSVPSWLSSDTNHAPKIPSLGPRRSAVEYIDPNTTTTSKPSSNPMMPIHENEGPAPSSVVSGPSVSAVRPRAPIVMQKDAIYESEKEFLAKDSPKRSRQRIRQQQNDASSRRVKQSLMESLRSLEFFDKTNRSRELTARHSVMRTLADPEGNVHFVNIDDDDLELELHQAHQIVSTQHSSTKYLCDDQAPETSKPKSSKPIVTQQPPPPSSSKAKTPVTEGFQIPELPYGQHLVFNILSTWGDPFYVGLMGIEVFDHTGHAVYLSDIDKQLSADPPDLNILASNESDRLDPRTVDKLVDNHYFTCDELHAWLAPFTRGQNHLIYLDFDYSLSISMIRIWNYNTTRIHSYRGARYMEISLDHRTIFKGEIRRAPGSVIVDMDACNECILFTTNSSILKLIEKYEKHKLPAPVHSLTPSTSDSSEHPAPVAMMDTRQLERPKTGSKRSSGTMSTTTSSSMAAPSAKLPVPPPPSLRPCTAPIMSDSAQEKPLSCQRVEIAFEANWGDPYDIGLTGMQFLDANYAPIKLHTDILRVRAPVQEETLRQVLVSSASCTNRHLSTQEMWSAPLDQVLGHRITIDFGQMVTLRAFKVWNFNASLEDSFKGVKQMRVYLDGKKYGSFSLRKAPGSVSEFDYGQYVHLRPHTNDLSTSYGSGDMFALHSPLQNAQEEHPTASSMKPIAEFFQQYQTPLFPTGYIIKFVFMSTWGDPHYLGLNGLELYDRQNNLVPLTNDMIDAQPRDINILKEPGAAHDVRTLDKLYDGVNNTYDDRHMWLSPFTPTHHNQLFVFFNEPVTLSKIRLWNYSKSPARGVKEFEIFMDDVLIYHGLMKQAPVLVLDDDEHELPLDNKRLRKKRYERAEAAAAAVDMTQTILFTDDLEIVEAEAHHIYLPEEELEESVTFYDNSQVLSLSDTPQRETMVRPTTSAGAGIIPPTRSGRSAYR